MYMFVRISVLEWMVVRGTLQFWNRSFPSLLTSEFPCLCSGWLSHSSQCWHSSTIDLYRMVACSFITLTHTRKVRQRESSKYHVQLCVAIFCMLLVFIAGIEQTSVYGVCVTVSILIHYFTLASVLWMTAEAVLMFHKLIFVFRKITTTYIVMVSCICWGEAISLLYFYWGGTPKIPLQVFHLFL